MFDLLIVKEDDDRRGRGEGEIAALIHAGATSSGMPEERLITVLNELEATRRTLSEAQPEDLVVIFADNITDVWKQVVYGTKVASTAVPRVR
jgi:cyanophycin synthetase